MPTEASTMSFDERREAVWRCLRYALVEAHRLGLVVRVDVAPVQPLAMGNHRQVVDVYPRRVLAPETRAASQAEPGVCEIELAWRLNAHAKMVG